MSEFKKSLGEQFKGAMEEENILEEIRKESLNQINDFLDSGGEDEDIKWLKGKIENYDSLNAESKQMIDELLENNPDYVRSIIGNSSRKKKK